MGLIAELKDKKAEMASWRQHLHQFPEIAYEEEMTSGSVSYTHLTLPTNREV